ncbi:ATP-binding protein [Melittangium boletus]|uniref:histidine kinase n=1 Tax=Melittangium boletus DSM 14713 TaxID=1294270 RepID=A0A250IFJ0_9BACT|nr:ATP-binding protein [Melittangium boletus]ATB30003.1 hypothetical protein MEBOL_003458 [Melittangium boletus DSM 14713]
MRPWTFARRIAVGFAVLLTVAGAIAGSTALALRTLTHSGTDAAILRQGLRLAEVERLRRAFSEKLASQRGYSLTGNASFVAEANLARGQFLGTLDDLRARPRTSDEAQALEAVARAEAEHQLAMQRLNEARESGGEMPQEWDAVYRRATDARDQTQESLEGLSWLTRQQLNEDASRARMVDHQVFWLVLAAATLGLLMAAGLAGVLTRGLWPLHREARVSQARFRLLVEGVKDYALYLLDTEGRVASWNPGAERIQGWSAGEIIGRPGALLYPPEAMADGTPLRERERAEREGRLESEGVRIHKDGTRFWAESLLTPLKDASGRLEGFAVLTRDISERKRLESGQRLLVEAEGVFHAEKDPEQAVAGLPRLLVPELADGCLLGLVSTRGGLEPLAVAHVSPEKEALLWELLRLPVPPPREVAGMRHVLRTGASELFTEVTPRVLLRMAPDAGHLSILQRLGVVSMLTVPLRAGGKTLGVLALVSQRAERRFTLTDQVFVEELAGRAALALENGRLLREAQAALELIGVAAHDLGNPLQALQLMLGKLRRLPPTEPEALREGLTRAVRHTQRLGRLLLNLLDLSRLSSGRLELELGEVNLAELVREAAVRHAEQSEEVGSPLVLRVEEVVGQWDKLRLERVLTNLLSNAFKYGKGHPIELTVERTGEGARLSVRDHGPGIPRDQQLTIFERFSKAPSVGERKEGFGLGLYIVRQLVEAHGGDVRVESAWGEGAAFIVELPLRAMRLELDADPAPPGSMH